MEVDQDGLHLLVEDDVFRLEVDEGEVLIVELFNADQEPPEDFEDLLEVEFVVLDNVQKLVALDVLHDYHLLIYHCNLLEELRKTRGRGRVDLKLRHEVVFCLGASLKVDYVNRISLGGHQSVDVVERGGLDRIVANANVRTFFNEVLDVAALLFSVEILPIECEYVIYDDD